MDYLCPFISCFLCVCMQLCLKNIYFIMFLCVILIIIHLYIFSKGHEMIKGGGIERGAALVSIVLKLETDEGVAGWAEVSSR